LKDSGWSVKSPEIDPGSGSGYTLTSNTSSPLDFYSPSMFPQDYGFHMISQPYALNTSTGMGDTYTPTAAWPMLDPNTPYFHDLEGGASNLVNATPSYNPADITDNFLKRSVGDENSKAEHSSNVAYLKSSHSKKSSTLKTSLSKASKGKGAKLIKSKKSSVYQPPRPSASYEEKSHSHGFDPANRTTHNSTERKYRNRLNEQFDALLSALPTSSTNNRSADDSLETKKISKAEILILAKERIESLEREKRELECEKCKYRESLDFLKLAYGTAINFPGQ
jgi:hypothetical protein